MGDNTLIQWFVCGCEDSVCSVPLEVVGGDSELYPLHSTIQPSQSLSPAPDELYFDVDIGVEILEDDGRGKARSLFTS